MFSLVHSKRTKIGDGSYLDTFEYEWQPRKLILVATKENTVNHMRPGLVLWVRKHSLVYSNSRKRLNSEISNHTKLAGRKSAFVSKPKCTIIGHSP
jgi:hypothetical protein